MLNPFSKLNRRVGIDLGSAQTRIWIQDHGLVIDEPSLIAVDQTSQKVAAVGEQAAQMKDRVSEQIQVFAPVDYPKLTDEALVKAMLKVFLQQASQEVYFFSPTMLTALPSNIYPVMRQVVVKVLTELGASEVVVVDQTLAAAIGAGVPVADASGTFLLQLGASVAEATSLSMGKIVKTYVSTQAGQSMCRDLIYWCKQHKNLEISEEIAQRIQQQLAAFMPQEEQTLTVSQLDSRDEVLQAVEISAQEISPIVRRYGQSYSALVKKLLANISPSLIVDIVDKGLLLSGGLAQLDGLEDYLISELGVPVFLVDEPESNVIRGVGQILQHLDEFKT